MTETQLKERKVVRKKWKNKRAKGKSASARTDGKLVRGIMFHDVRKAIRFLVLESPEGIVVAAATGLQILNY